ncbi:hypothetical protein ACQ4PT_052998 [Festuca glaucescens]
MTAEQACDVVAKNQKVFAGRAGRGGLFSSRPEAVFKKVFGDLTVRDAAKPLLVPCYDMATAALESRRGVVVGTIIERKSDLARLESLDCGKPLDETAWDMDDVAGCFEYFAGHAESLDKRQNSEVSLPENFKCHIKKEPIGVVGLITPWNYPLLMATWKVAPALAAGCTAVLKPSELASVTCLELADVCKEVGLPSGVLNVVTGLGPEAGAPLSSHPDVNKAAFTGSYETGKKIMIAAAPTVKPVTLELGGKSPIVVFDDVDIDKGTFDLLRLIC